MPLRLQSLNLPAHCARRAQHNPCREHSDAKTTQRRRHVPPAGTAATAIAMHQGAGSACQDLSNARASRPFLEAERAKSKAKHQCTWNVLEGTQRQAAHHEHEQSKA
jgi:hypothetical protein